jgi:uncharacterized protein (TIGR00369 family)
VTPEQDFQPLAPDDERRVREVFARVPFPRLLGMRLEALGRGVCRMSVALRDDLRQRYGVMHGGVIASLVDTAVAYAIYPQIPPERELTTVEMKVSFLASVREGGSAVAEARLLRLGRTLAVCSCDVFDDGGRRVAAALVTYMVIPAPEGAAGSGRKH